MNITKGPTLQKFADIFDIAIDEVVAWVNGYVNAPEKNYTEQHRAGLVEATEKARFDTMRKYIDWRIETSTHGRIERSIAESQRLAA